MILPTMVNEMIQVIFARGIVFCMRIFLRKSNVCSNMGHHFSFPVSAVSGAISHTLFPEQIISARNKLNIPGAHEIRI